MIFLGSEHYVAVKSSTYYQQNIHDIYAPKFVIDDTINTKAVYYWNFYSWQKKCPWVEIELDTIIDMTGLEITMSYYAAEVKFKNIQIRNLARKVNFIYMNRCSIEISRFSL